MDKLKGDIDTLLNFAVSEDNTNLRNKLKEVVPSFKDEKLYK